jgi:hypothetical protein
MTIRRLYFMSLHIRWRKARITASCDIRPEYLCYTKESTNRILPVMERAILFAAYSFLFLFTHAQNNMAQADRVVTTDDGNLSIVVQKGGTYMFSYQNQMSNKPDLRTIVFKNKQEIKGFEKKISKALSAKDGTSDLITYKTYKIRLLTEIGGVFMIVNEPGQSQSTLRITKEMYNQVNVL